MPKFQIDGKIYEAAAGKNLLETCLSAGLDLPYFCWHPAMGSVGACRQCAVKQFKDEKDMRGKLVMACMTPVQEGALFSVEDAQAKEFRASVIEWLMLNHPHDCPVCDEGGECHLQDMTVMTGHSYRRYRFKKRSYRNQDLGPFVNHEMNRCIACYRCVRFYRDYAGGHDLNVFSVHDRVYFGRREDGVLESEFSGNLVEVCPTGVFTDKTLKSHYARKWDLQTAPSVCVHCGLGCNTIPGERYGVLRRVRNRYNDEINGYFLCDRGRYGYEFVNSDRRIRDVWFRNGALSERGGQGITELGRRIRSALDRGAVIGIGSPRASLEACFALRSLVGSDSFYAGMSVLDSELTALLVRILKEGSVPVASLREIEHADAAIVLGEDVTNSAPRLALALRQAARNVHGDPASALQIPSWQDAAIREVVQEQKAPLFVLSSYRTKLEEVARKAWTLSPDEIARMGFAIAHAIDHRFPGVPDLPEVLLRECKDVAQTLLNSKRPVIVSGTSAGSSAVLKAAANVASALHSSNPDTRLSLAASEVNSVGLALLDPRPISEALTRSSGAEIVIVLENDLFRRGVREEVKSFLKSAQIRVVLDHTATGMVPLADVLLPSASFAEGTGSFVNHEGRVQRFYAVFSPGEFGRGSVKESWRWIEELARASGQKRHWASVDDVIAEMSESIPVLNGVRDAAPPASFRKRGEKIARKPHRYSGRTSMHADRSVQEPKPPQDIDSPFSFSMEGYQVEGLRDEPSALTPRYWSPGWNSVQSLNKFQEEVGGRLRGGNAGKRLLAPAPGARLVFSEIPPAFVPRHGQWLAIPIQHIFGSDELSQLSPGIAKLAPRPYIAIHPEDAARLEAGEGEPIQIALARSEPLRLRARIDPSLPRGVIGLPFGLAYALEGLEGISSQLPAWVELSARVLKPVPGAA